MNNIKNSILYLAALSNKARIYNLETGQAAIFSYPSTNIAEENQDSAAIISLEDKHEKVLAVSDGAGGQPGGQSASQVIIKELQRELLDDANKEQLLRASILNALEDANKSIIESKTGGGATACVVSIDNNILRPFHVGDSVIAVIGQRGKLIYRNTEHSPLGYAIRSEIVDEKHLDDEVSHEVFNLVGNQEMHIEIGPEIKLKKFDTLFMSSDGITDFVPLNECLEIIRSGSLEIVASLLVERYFNTVKDITHKDDATFILYRI